MNAPHATRTKIPPGRSGRAVDAPETRLALADTQRARFSVAPRSDAEAGLHGRFAFATLPPLASVARLFPSNSTARPPPTPERPTDFPTPSAFSRVTAPHPMVDPTPPPSPSDPSPTPDSSALFTQVYNELRRIAASRLARESQALTLQPTALVHEAWLQLEGRGGRQWANRTHFFGAAADAMRRILIDRSRRRSRKKHGAGLHREDLADVDPAALPPDDTVLLINEAIEQLERENPVQARVVVLKFFGGLTNQEVATQLGLSERTVDRFWSCAKTQLYDWVRSQR